MLVMNGVLELKLGDIVDTPNGHGFYQGRWWQDGHVTHLIIRHHIEQCKDEDLIDIALQLGEREVVCYYPVDQVVPL